NVGYIYVYEYSFMNKVLVIFIITFVSIVDILALIITKTHFFGIYKVFLILGVLFILQDYFRWFKIIFGAVIAISSLISLFIWVVNIDAYNVFELILNKVFVPAAIPLYFSISFILILWCIFLNNFKTFR